MASDPGIANPKTATPYMCVAGGLGKAPENSTFSNTANPVYIGVGGVAELMHTLTCRGVKLERVGPDRIEATGPRGSITPELRQALTQAKPLLLELLQPVFEGQGGEEAEERLAIQEEDSPAAGESLPELIRWFERRDRWRQEGFGCLLAHCQPAGYDGRVARGVATPGDSDPTPLLQKGAG